MTATQPTHASMPVAIIGMGCRLPGNIDSPDLFWKALVERRDCVTRIPQDRWERMVSHLHPDQVPTQPYPAGAVDHVFDHAAFGISPDEASEMDPQQGWILEVAHEALADAGIAPTSLSGTLTGVYVGAASTDQPTINFGLGRRAGVFTGSGAGMSILANRLSYVLDVDGPSLVLDTACSSSLTALHYAVRGLRSGEIDTAVVAGTNILTNPTITASFTETGVLSPRGRCAPFDRDADGYVRSEGTVVLVLTSASVAAERGHRVWAHVAGTGIGHGGKAPHLLAPRASRQSAAISRALADAGISAEQVGWVQAHGTGTKAGDRVEAEGIADALGQGSPVVVGSVKSVLGHLEGAAGVVGVMTAALALHHGQVPPTAGHQHLRSGLEKLVRVPTRVEAWPAEEEAEVAVAGVSSFGFGGANAHAILTQSHNLTPPTNEDPMPLPETVLVSAHSAAALAHAAGGLAERAPVAGSVGVVADTALACGPHGRYRSAVVADNLGALVQGLRALQDGTPTSRVLTPRAAPQVRPRLAFVYTGHGGHHPDAGVELMKLPVFARAVEEARAALAQQTGYQVWAPGQPVTSFVDAQHCTALVEIGLTALLAERGIVPDLVLGHSVGELAAAHTAGVLGLDAVARVLAERSHLLSGVGEAGGLLAIRAGVDRVEAATVLYQGRVTIASYSAPEVQVVAGPHADLDHLYGLLAQEGVWSKPVLDVIPAHSAAVDPVVPALREALAGLVPHPAQVPIISTAYPNLAQVPVRLWSPAYWADQARQPVRFTDALRTAASVLGSEPVVFIEVGPKALLSEHIAHTLPETATVAVTSAPDGPARGVGELYTSGLTPSGPTDRAHPGLVIPPGWDHTGRPAVMDEGGPPSAPPPGPESVLAYLATEIGRLTPLHEGFDPDSTWSGLGLESHSLLHLTSRLRRVPEWAGVDIQVFLPERTWRQVAAELTQHLAAPADLHA